MTTDAREFQAELQRLDSLIRGVERFADPSARAHIQEVARSVLDLHRAGIERFLSHIEEAGKAGQHILDACLDDDAIGGLLLLHGLHPLSVEERVLQAFDQVRPYLRSHGGGVELLEVDGDTVRLRLLGSCDGCQSSAATMQQTVEEAILGKAPEILIVEVEKAEPEPELEVGRRGRVALTVL